MAWIAAVAGMGASALGKQQAGEATIEGAETEAGIAKLDRHYQRKIFDEGIEAQEPYMEAGYAALPYLEEFRTTGGMDLSGNALNQKQDRLGREGLALSGHNLPATQNYFTELQNASGQDPAYQRLLDMQRIGLGSAGTAGTYAQNQGNALSSSYQNAGNALMRGTGMEGAQRSSMFSNAAAQAGAMPSYFDYQKRTR